MDSLWVLLYSKFSPRCTELINAINSNVMKVRIEALCVDNAKLRERIATSKKFNIEHVPCILHINKATGVVEQYEGEKSFQLIGTLVEEQPQVQVHPPAAEQQQQIQPRAQPQAQPAMTMIDDLDDREEQHQPSPLKQKISPGDIMALVKSREGDNPQQPQQQQPIAPVETQKKTGKPVDIAAAMSAAQRRE